MEGQETIKKKRRAGGAMWVMAVQVGSLAVCIAYMTITMVGIGGFEYSLMLLLDFPTLLIIAAMCVPVLAASGLWGDFLRAFLPGREGVPHTLVQLKRTQAAVQMMQRQIVYAGVMSISHAVILLLSQLSMPERIGPSMGVAVLSAFYVAVLELLLLPLRVKVEKQLIDYMEGE